MAGWEKIMTPETAPTKIAKQSGTSQLETLKRLVLTSSNTSPGTAKIFSNRAANDVLESLGSWGGDCWIGGGSSIAKIRVAALQRPQSENGGMNADCPA